MNLLCPWSFALLCLVLIGCDTAEEEPLLLSFETLDESQSFSVITAGTQVIRDEQAWTDLWELSWAIFNGQGEKTPPPSIDFANKMVIAVFWGGEYSGCSNGVEAIKQVRIINQQIEVEIGPLPDLGPCDAIVYPVHMILLDRSNLQVTFVGEVPS